MPRRPLRTLPLLLALVVGCAVVDSITTGLRTVGRWAEGLARGEGEVVDGVQEGEWTFTTEDGRLRARGGYVDDVQDGPWTYWYPNGNKEYEGTFARERRVGLWRYWHPNGNPRAQGHFVEGREFGEWMFWSSRGTLSQRGAFLNGLQTGPWTYRAEDGTVQAEGLFHEGQRVGAWTFHEPGGQVRETWQAFPEGTAYVREAWPEGGTRREGFLLNGRQHGLWTLRHRDGTPRMVGTFENGTAQGPWVAFRADGERLASGRVELGRPQGEWTVLTESGPSTWSAAGAGPPPPFTGEWSADDLPDSASLETVLGTWIAESLAPVDPGDQLAATAPEPGTDEEPDAEELAVVEAEPDVPIQAQPWTRRELEEYEDYVRAYEGGETPRKLASRYAGAAGRGGAPELATGGDVDRGRSFLGKPLPLTVFKDQTGRDVDLAGLRGKRVVLVVLRGFGGGVCVYCTAQTRAFCSAGAFEQFEQLGAELMVVFPGPRNGLEAFKRGYEALNQEEIPPYGLLYENDYIVSELMDLEGNKVVPSTFVLDEQGIVRFAYIGQHEADRPSVERVVEALRELASGS